MRTVAPLHADCTVGNSVARICYDNISLYAFENLVRTKVSNLFIL